MSKIVTGFSKLTKAEKIDWVVKNYFKSADTTSVKSILTQYFNADDTLQQLHDDFIENTISNFYLPFGVAPNFVINNKPYVIPMAIEESSVVAAAALVGKFWSTRGGFKTTVIGTTKVGQVHFMYAGSKQDLETYFNATKTELFAATAGITKNMQKRGGGILDIKLVDKTAVLANYYQLHVTFETKDSMGANFINSCLEAIANAFKTDAIDIVMSILSNYLPDCVVRAEVSCNIEDLGFEDSQKFAEKFYQAVQIAHVEPYRAVTHNKGIMNGIDAVVIATGNDFRAIEAGAHAYAAKDGNYKSLSHCTIDNGVFKFWIELPLALGTVGGLTALHPLAKLSLELLQKPTAPELMQIIAAAGLAQNFAALRALTTKGIQHGHMKMHLQNILNQLGATATQKTQIEQYFKNKTVTHAGVVNYFKKIKNATNTINWVPFLDTTFVKKTLSNLDENTAPLFGKMNAQQMVEHLSLVVKISNGRLKVNDFVADEKAKRRQQFLHSDNEIEAGFKPKILADVPNPLQFKTMQLAIEDLVEQITQFTEHFKTAKTENHPFFGDLDKALWMQFHTKHFTHHFKQFKL